MYSILFIYSAIKGDWVASQLLAMWMMLLCTWVHNYLFKTLLSVYLTIYSEAEFLGRMVILLLILGGVIILFSIAALWFYIPINSTQDSNFSTFLPVLAFFFFFDSNCPVGCEVITHCGFVLHFPNDKWCWVSFHVYISFREMSVELLCPF